MSSSAGVKSPYRADIDGLRAVAVLTVMLFHLHAEWMPGGFIGVDVFFVISGFLISSHIFAAVEAGEFSFRDFYLRRINRILPALYGVILFTFALGLLFFLPADVYAICHSAISALKFKANIYFARDYDYFRPVTAEVPLLNLWSLSVEEQFYFILPPFVLWILWRCKKSWRPAVVSGLLIASLFYAEHLLQSHSLQDAYYSVFSRASELLAGTLLAIVPPRAVKPWLKNVSGLAGLALIFAGCFLFSGKTPFPGFASLVPSLGAVMVLAAEGSWPSALLATPFLVFVGQISYSLYLYHWPLMATARYLTEQETFTWTMRAGLAAASFALATLSWRYIETPYRRNPRPFGQTFLWRFLTPSLALILALSWVAGQKGLPERLGRGGAERLQRSIDFLTEHYCHGRGHYDDDKCKYGDLTQSPKLMLIGDSTAGHYQPLLDEFAQRSGFAFKAHSYGDCLPFVHENGTAPEVNVSPECLEIADWTASNWQVYDVIALSTNWSYTLAESPDAAGNAAALRRSIALWKQGGKRVVLLEQLPGCPGLKGFLRQKFSPVASMFPTEEIRREVVAGCGHDSEVGNAKLKALAAETGAVFVGVISLYRENHDLPFSGEDYFYKDSRHFNLWGSQQIGRSLAAEHPELRAMLLGQP